MVALLQRELPLPAAGLAVRDVIRACNSEYAPIAMQAATAAAAGEDVDVEVAIAEAEPFLRERISLAVERAVARG